MAARGAALILLATLPLALDAGPLPARELSFEKNQGQTDKSVDFIARGKRYASTLHAGSYSIALRTGGGDKLPRWTLSPLERFARPPATPWVISMYLAGGDLEAAAEGLEPLAARSHYLRGKDPSEWQTDVPHYGRVRYQDVYPGIDIEYYGNSGAMEFDFIVRPGADPGRIRMEFEGAASAEIDDDGDLVLRRGEQELRHRKPLVYQTVLGRRAEVAGRYHLEEDGAVTFRLSDYDAGLTVVIDPLIAGQTFGSGGWQQTVGGSGDDQFNAVAVGPDGTIHVAGTTDSPDIPTQGGWGTSPPGGSSDAYVGSFGPDGGLMSGTYLGGSGQDVADDIAVGPDGRIYVIGTTNSPNFPITDGAFQPSFGGIADAFVTILSPDGSDLVGSTFLGGPGVDLGTGIARDNQGHGFFVTGATFASGFPVTEGAFQTDLMGEADGFVSKIDGMGSRLMASTLYGGTGLDIPIDIIVGDDGGPYIVGETDSMDLPLTGNAFQPQPGGGVDIFGGEFPHGLDHLDYGTYFGGPGDDRPHGADLDDVRRVVWIGGRTTGELPTTPNAPNPDFLGGPSDGFLVRLPIGSLGPEGTLGFDPYTNEPLVTYTGDENQNAVLDVQLVDNEGRLLVVTSGSNSSEDPSPVAGCGDEPRTGVTGLFGAWDPIEGTPIDLPPLNFRNQICLPNGDILDLESDPFFDFGKVYGSGFQFAENNSDGTVIQIDTDAVFKSEAGADLELEKMLVFPRKKLPPGVFQVFVIYVRNKGPDSAVNVRVTDSIGNAFKVEAIEAKGVSCTQAGGEITCDLGTMPPNTSKRIEINGNSPGDVGDYINTALATANNLTGPTRIASVTYQVRPFVPLDLQNTAVSTDSGRVEFRLEVENRSQDKDATNVKLEDLLPPLFGVEAESSRGKCDLSTDPIGPTRKILDCTLDVLPPGDTWVVRVHGFPSQHRYSMTNLGEVNSDQSGSRDFDSATVSKTECTAAADLRSSFNFSDTDEFLGGVQEEVRQGAATMCKGLDAAVFNQGFDDASGVQLEMDQISSAEFRSVDPSCSVSGNRLNCNIGELAAFSSKRLQFVVCADGETEIARIRGTVTAATPDPDPANDFDRAAAVLDDPAGNVRIFPGGIVSSSGFHRPLVVSPGSDPSLFGEGLADGVIVADTVPLPLELGGVSVELNGILAPLIFVSPNQINFQTPWELQADTKATVVVRNNGDESLPAKVFIAPFNPGIFTTTQTGSGQAAILIAGTRSVAAPEGSIPGAATRPVKIGEFISIFATGLGAVDNRPITGDSSPAGPLARTKTNPVVTIGGVEAGLTFSGLAPGFVGLYQVNAKIAAGTPVGDAVELVVSSGLVPSNAVTIAVAPQ